jgi:hypothetical protein
MVCGSHPRSSNNLPLHRDETLKDSGWLIISGIISNETAPWNSEWSYHIVPETVFFAWKHAMPVRRKLDDTGGAFLPNKQWFPWGSAVLEEIANSNETELPSSVPTIWIAGGTTSPSSAPVVAWSPYSSVITTVMMVSLTLGSFFLS